MTRHTIIAALLLMATTAGAQNVWERPTEQVAKQQEPEKAAETKAKDEATELKDARYLAGAVTEKDGKVSWTLSLDIPGQSAQQIYDSALKYLTNFTKNENQLDESSVSLVNKSEHIIVASIREWLVFKDAFLSLDRAKFFYTLIATCNDGKMTLEMCRLSYRYNDGTSKREEKIMAEDAINDKNALNKKKTKLVKGWTKFRKKTVDRKDYIFNDIAQHFNNQQISK